MSATLELSFFDPIALEALGLKLPNPAQIQCQESTIPNVGDLIRFAGVDFPTGEPAIFVVVLKTHLFGGQVIQRVQLDLELRVVVQQDDR